jgi:tetratricopeptide (TPR) repeat protein
MTHQGRGERALTNLNLAISIAEADGLRALKAYLLSMRAKISMERDNLVVALRLFRQAEELLDQEGQVMEALSMRYSAAEALLRLGERADAAAFLEDLQTKLMRGRHFRNALDPLNLLGKIYEESGSWDERDRITELLHLCGQSIVQGDPSVAGHAYSEPEVRLVPAPPENGGAGQSAESNRSADSVAGSVAEGATDSTGKAPPKA